MFRSKRVSLKLWVVFFFCLCGFARAVLAEDISFIQQATLPVSIAPMSPGHTQTLFYTIHNNTPVSIALLDISIRILPEDTLPVSAITRDNTIVNNCGRSLASGASCNIQLVLFAQQKGRLARVLHIGIDTRQVRLDSRLNTSIGDVGIDPLYASGQDNASRAFVTKLDVFGGVWQNISVGLPNPGVAGTLAFGAHHVLYTGGQDSNGAAYVSAFDGKRWHETGLSALIPQGEVLSLAYGNGILYAGGQGVDGTLFVMAYDGKSWQTTGIENTFWLGSVNSLFFGNGTLYAGGNTLNSDGQAIAFVASYKDHTWTDTGLEAAYPGAGLLMNVNLGANGLLYAGGQDIYNNVPFVWFYQNGHWHNAMFTLLPQDAGIVNSLAFANNILYAGGQNFGDHTPFVEGLASLSGAWQSVGTSGLPSFGDIFSFSIVYANNALFESGMDSTSGIPMASVKYVIGGNGAWHDAGVSGLPTGVIYALIAG